MKDERLLADFLSWVGEVPASVRTAIAALDQAPPVQRRLDELLKDSPHGYVEGFAAGWSRAVRQNRFGLTVEPDAEVSPEAVANMGVALSAASVVLAARDNAALYEDLNTAARMMVTLRVKLDETARELAKVRREVRKHHGNPLYRDDREKNPNDM